MKKRRGRPKKRAGGKLSIRIIGPEVFNLPKTERRTKFSEDLVLGLSCLLGDQDVEQILEKPDSSGRVLVGRIIPPESVMNGFLLDRRARYLGLLEERDKKRTIVRGCVLVLEERKSELEVSDFFVQPNRRNQGWGGKLLQKLVGRIRKDRAGEKISLAVAIGNEKAVSFYERNGFSTVAVQMTMSLTKKKAQRKVPKKGPKKSRGNARG